VFSIALSPAMFGKLCSGFLVFVREIIIAVLHKEKSIVQWVNDKKLLL
jgi:hypothetical protein